MRLRLLIAIGCLWTGCGPSQRVDRVAPRDRPPGDARPPTSLPDPDAVPPAAALDAGPAGAEAGAPDPEGPPPPAGPVDAGVQAPDRPPPPPAPAPDAAPPDRAPSVPPPALPPPDAAPPPADRPPPAPDAAAACPPEPAADRIADFEGGSLATLRVGARGGTPWTIISLEEGSTGAIAAAPVPERCGSRSAMRFAGTTADTRAPIVRALLLEDTPDPRFFDARGYRALRVWLKAVPAGSVRIKISDGNTTRAGGVCTGCNNHFVFAVAADGELRPHVIPFAEMRQDLEEELQPALNAGALFAVEIVPPRLPVYEIVVDDISFVK